MKRAFTRKEWEAEYARLCHGSGYFRTSDEAYQEATDAWENQQQRCARDPIATPAEAFCIDKREWMTR